MGNVIHRGIIMTELYHGHLYPYGQAKLIIASETSQTQYGGDHLDICAYNMLPQVGEYILSKCRTMAFRVLRHQKAEACGNKLTVVFVSDPTPVAEENPHGEKGVKIHMHNQKCTSHCIDEYYLMQPKSYGINAIF